MNKDTAIEVQKSIATDAISLVSIFGDSADVQLHQKSIVLIGKAWNVPKEETSAQLDLIQREQEIMHEVQDSGKADHVLNDEALRHCWTGMETLEVLEDLFATAIRLNSYDDRKTMLNMATALMEHQNFLDWIEKTPAEKELPEAANA